MSAVAHSQGSVPVSRPLCPSSEAWLGPQTVTASWPPQPPARSRGIGFWHSQTSSSVKGLLCEPSAAGYEQLVMMDCLAGSQSGT